jgi:hypothetical protein
MELGSVTLKINTQHTHKWPRKDLFLFKNTKICSILSELKLRTVIGRAREEEKEDKTIQALAGPLGTMFQYRYRLIDRWICLALLQPWPAPMIMNTHMRIHM